MNEPALRAYIAATVVYARHRAIADTAAHQRAVALLAMSQTGMSHRDIARVTGLSAPRVGQLVAKVRTGKFVPAPTPWPEPPKEL